MDRRLSYDSLKKVGKLFGQVGWNKRFTELDEQDVLYLISSIQQMKDIADDVNETYLAAIWLKFNISDKEAEFPFGKNKPNNVGNDRSSNTGQTEKTGT